MATNLTISENQERVPLSVGTRTVLRSVTPDNGSPYYVGARAYVTQNEDGATVTVIDKEGTTTADIFNGQDGADGADGFSPIATVSKVGDTATISITDANGTTTATVTDGADGQDGRDGVDGQDGTDGVDGYSPTATVTKSGDTATISITDENGTTTATVSDGADGTDGTDGQDGYSPSATVTKSGTVATITITDKDGTTTAEVYDGSGSISDVEVDGTSVVTGGVAEIDLTGKSDVGHTHTKSAITDFPTNVSSFVNDAGYLTSFTETDPIFSASAASGISSSDITNWDGKSDFSGDYDDLSNKPTIPSDTGDLTNGAGFLNKSGILDLFYPIGSYYETSDTSFDPNITWGGTWELEAEGKAHVSAGSTYTAGTSYGSDTHTHTTGNHTLTTSEMPYHRHTYDYAKAATDSHTLTTTEIPAHTHGSKTVSYNFRVTQGTGAALVYAGTNSTVTSNSNKTQPATSGSGTYSSHQVNLSASHTHDSVGGSGGHTHAISTRSGTTGYTGGTDGTTQAHNHGNTGSSDSWQPSIAVNRWHRTA